MNRPANRTLNNFFSFFFFLMSTHIPQGLNSGAEARKIKKKKSANEMTPSWTVGNNPFYNSNRSLYVMAQDTQVLQLKFRQNSHERLCSN